MTPPVFFAVAAFGFAAPLMAQTPVHSMPREARAAFTCLAMSDEVGDADALRSSGFKEHLCNGSGEEAIRSDRNVLLFSDLHLLAPAAHFCPVRTEAIEGLEGPAPDLEEMEDPAPEDRSSPMPGGVITVGRSTSSSTAAPVPEPSTAVLAAIAVAGLIRRRRRA